MVNDLAIRTKKDFVKTTRRSWFAQTTALLLLLAASQAVHQVLLSKNMQEHFIRPEHNKWKRAVTGDRHLVVQPAGLYGRHTEFPHYLVTDILQCSRLTCMSWRNTGLPHNGDRYVAVKLQALCLEEIYDVAAFEDSHLVDCLSWRDTKWLLTWSETCCSADCWFVCPYWKRYRVFSLLMTDFLLPAGLSWRHAAYSTVPRPELMTVDVLTKCLSVELDTLHAEPAERLAANSVTFDIADCWLYVW
jgi:hypothetical protein